MFVYRVILQCQSVMWKYNVLLPLSVQKCDFGGISNVSQTNVLIKIVKIHILCEILQLQSRIIPQSMLVFSSIGLESYLLAFLPWRKQKSWFLVRQWSLQWVSVCALLFWKSRVIHFSSTSQTNFLCEVFPLQEQTGSYCNRFQISFLSHHPSHWLWRIEEPLTVWSIIVMQHKREKNLKKPWFSFTASIKWT